MPLNPSPQSSGSVGFVGSPGLAASLGMGGSPVSSGVDSPSTSATAGTSSGSSGSSGSFMFPPSPLGKREGKGLEVIGEEEEEEKEVKDEEEKLAGVMRKLDFEEKDGGKGKKEV